MNGLIKKIGAGILAVAIAVLSVASVSTSTYALNICKEGDKNYDGLKCSACVGAKMADGSARSQAGGENATGDQIEAAARSLCNNDDAYSVNSIWTWIYTIINWVLIAVGIIAVVFIIIGGIRYATSSGDSDKVKNAKNTILYAVIGLVIAILASVIVRLVFQVTGTIVE